MATSLEPLATLFCTGAATHTHFYLKTRVPEPFWTFERSFLCTGAVTTHFVHKRGGFAKLCKTIAPVNENRSCAKSTYTHGNLTVLTEKVRRPRAVWHFFNSRPRFCQGRLSELFEPFFNFAHTCAQKLKKKTISETFFSICVHSHGATTLFHHIYRRP